MLPPPEPDHRNYTVIEPPRKTREQVAAERPSVMAREWPYSVQIHCPNCGLAARERRVRVIEAPAAPPLGVSEAAFQRLVTDLAEWCGWHWTFNADSRRTQAGVPDLLLMRGRKCLWREIKTESGKLRPEQLAFGQRLLRAGQDWCVWKPSDWRTIVETLTEEA